MPSDPMPSGQPLPARVPMLPSPPALESLAAPTQARPALAAHRLMLFFDGGLFRFVAFIAITPLLLTALGHSLYGMLAVATALVGYLGVAHRGVQEESTRLVTAARRVGDLGRVRIILASALAVLGGMGVLLAAGVAAASSSFVTFFGATDAQVHVCALFLTLEAARAGLTVTAAAWTAGAESLGQQAHLRAWRGAATLAQVAGVLFVVGNGWGLFGLGIVGASAAAFGLVAEGGAAVLPGTRLSWRDVDRSVVGRLLVAAALPGAGGAALVASFDAGILVLAAVVGLEAVAIYAIAAHGCRLLLGLALHLSGGLYPTFSTLALHGDRLQMRWVFRRAMDATLLTTAGLALIAIAFGRPMLELWLGVKQADGTVAALGVSILTAAPVVVAGRYAARAGLVRTVATVAALEAVLCVVLALLLIGPYGTAGVALAAAAAQLLTGAWYFPMVACRHLAISPARFWLARAWRLSIVLGPALIAAIVAVAYKPPRNAKELAVEVGIVAILYSVSSFAAWYLLETRPETDAD